MFALLPLALAFGADPTFTPEAQFRPRFEADSGRDFDADTGNVAFITHRARLGGTFGTGPIELRVVFQDVRAWGEERDTRRDFSGDGIDLGMATLTWRPHDDLAVIVGRDEISLLDERLIARANWRQPGRRFNGARVRFGNGTWGAEAGGFLVVDSDLFLFEVQDQVEPSPPGDQTLWFARGGREEENLTAQAVVVVDDRRDTFGAEALRVTPGVFVKGRSGPWSGRVEAYGQVGNRDGRTRSVRAGMVGVRGTVAPDTGAKPVLGVAYDLLSGDGDLTDDTFTAFDTVRGANHRYYGNQDIAVFFRGGPGPGLGLHDPHLTLGMSPAKAVSVRLVQHLFAPAVGNDWVAVEPDASIAWAVHESVKLTGGASVWADIRGPATPVETFAYVTLDAALKGPKLGGASD